LLPKEILSLITYSREKLLDIREMSTYQHYDQEYNFPKEDPLFGPPPRTMDLIPEADPKQRRRRRRRRSSLLVRLCRRAHCPPLPSILLQSLDNKVDEVQGLPSRETSEIATFSVSRKHGSLGIHCRNSHRASPCHWASPCIAPTEINTSLGRGRVGVYAS
jgi:hypothetical protein